MSKEKKAVVYRVGTLSASALIAFALLVDGLEGISTAGAVGLVTNWLTYLLKWPVFLTWMWLEGVHLTKLSSKKAKRRAVVLLGGLAAGLIPVINAFPEFTFVVAVAIFDSWSEDKTGMNISKIVKARQSLRKSNRQKSRRGSANKNESTTRVPNRNSKGGSVGASTRNNSSGVTRTPNRSKTQELKAAA